MSTPRRPHIAIVGAGFAGLSAGYELAKAGWRVTLVERESSVGGLAGCFTVGGARLEKFYHHWFTNDRHVHDLVDELGVRDRVVYRPTRTGAWYANSVFRLSRPLDVLRYRPLSLLGRFRLGFLVVQARLVRDWRQLEHLSARDWLISQCGREVYARVWEPLLRGKFGRYADDVSAVWFWNKLKLRGGSRGRGGEEQLAYYRGGFAALAEKLAGEITARGGHILTGRAAEGLIVRGGRACGVRAAGGGVEADAVLVTTPLPVFADLAHQCLPADYLNGIRRIRYLANICLTLELDHSLSQTYWLNVADPEFPFVGIIEHTNFEPAATYAGRHIVYLSKYLPADDPLYAETVEGLLDYAQPYLQRMFPAFERGWIRAAHLHRADHAQPVVTRNYGALIPDERAPLAGLYLATMAQIYPQDRGTNYAIGQGRAVARTIMQDLAAAGAAAADAA